jgi:hypothetical protein
LANDPDARGGHQDNQVTQRIAPLNDDEKAWVARNIDLARRVIAAHANEGSQLDPEGFDRTVVAWYARREDDRIEPSGLANVLGIAFGQYLVDTLQMRWAVVTDEHGTELAVHGSPSDVVVFPTAAVAKRIVNGDVPFFVHLYEQLSADITNLRRRIQ